MNGMNAKTGKKISDVDHLRQSIEDILVTPIGSRVMVRDYGSKLYELVDKPFNSSLKIEIISATAKALKKWEPRIDINKITVNQTEVGKIFINISGFFFNENKSISIEGLQTK